MQVAVVKAQSQAPINGETVIVGMNIIGNKIVSQISCPPMEFLFDFALLIDNRLD